MRRRWTCRRPALALPASAALLAAFAPGTVLAGPATGTDFHRTVVLEPMAQAPRYVKVADGAECDPVPDNFDDFQAFDASFDACVPAFVRDGLPLAKLVGSQTVTSCLEPEGGGTDVMTLTADTVFPAASNPGLSTDLVLPTQTFVGGGIDPGSDSCQGDTGEPGATIPDTGWFPVPASSCIVASGGACVGGVDYGGMVIPIDGSQPGDTISELLAAAAKEVFSQTAGFDPVPMLVLPAVDGNGDVTGTDRFCAASLGAGSLPSCSGVASSEQFTIEVHFAQPAGFAPPPPVVPSLPLGGLLVLATALVGAGWLARKPDGKPDGEPGREPGGKTGRGQGA